MNQRTTKSCPSLPSLLPYLLRAMSISRRAEESFFLDLSTFFMSSYTKGGGGTEGGGREEGEKEGGGRRKGGGMWKKEHKRKGNL